MFVIIPKYFILGRSASTMASRQGVKHGESAGRGAKKALAAAAAQAALAAAAAAEEEEEKEEVDGEEEEEEEEGAEEEEEEAEEEKEEEEEEEDEAEEEEEATAPEAPQASGVEESTSRRRGSASATPKAAAQPASPEAPGLQPRSIAEIASSRQASGLQPRTAPKPSWAVDLGLAQAAEEPVARRPPVSHADHMKCKGPDCAAHTGIVLIDLFLALAFQCFHTDAHLF